MEINNDKRFPLKRQQQQQQQNSKVRPPNKTIENGN